MTRKDYRLIAEAIAECIRVGDDGIHAIAENLCCYLKKDNSNFDKERFLKACGLVEETSCGIR